MVRIVVLASIALVIAACGTERNPDFCCTSTDSCRASGTTVGVIGCDDPVKSYCDDNGVYGAPRTCIADPISNECDSPNDCMNPERPYCINNRCVECEDGAMCANPAPACSAVTHLCGPCGVAADCVGDAGGDQCVDGACVECDTPDDCAATEPFCEVATHTCRGCLVDGECASDVCDRSSGACAAPADVLYVAVGGTGLTCTQAAPCATINAALALAGMNRTIKIGPGTYTESLVVTGARTIRFHGAGAGASGTTIAAPGANVHVISIMSGASVAIDDLVVTGANGGTAPNAVRCVGSTVALRRTLIDINPGGGVGITGCNFELVNNIITRNGGPASLFGGVSLSDLLGGTTVRFAFNTIARNSATTGNIAGVSCSQIGVPVPIESSIVYDNGAPGDPEIGADNDCAASHSVLGEAVVSGTNVNTNPGFVSGTDAHLGAASAVEGLADDAATLDHDVDGNVRPQGSGRDPGADEIMP